MAWDINTEADYVQEESNKEYFRSSEIYERIKRDFYRKIKVTANGCWDWTSQYNASNGEPHLVFKTPETSEFDARIVAYNYNIDTLFAGEKITMSCGNTMCVNPAHMQIERKEVEMEKDIYARNYLDYERAKVERYREEMKTPSAVARYERAVIHLEETINARKNGTPFLRVETLEDEHTTLLFFSDGEWVVLRDDEYGLMSEKFTEYEYAVNSFDRLKVE